MSERASEPSTRGGALGAERGTVTARRPLIAGNWKMNCTLAEGEELVRTFVANLAPDLHQRVDIAVLPPFPLLAAVRAILSVEDPYVMCGGQDLSPHDKGAHTGDVSGPMLCSVGCRYVVVGHSERRAEHGEDDALVAAKVAAALRHGLTPILCVGEGLDVREADDHVAHTVDQLDAALDGVSAEAAAGVVLAYEPVWAIGTGAVATPDDAEEVCGAIRERLRAAYDDAVADRVRVLYGGSVKADNVAELMAQPDVDGALVGGACLDAPGFAALCSNAATA
jgi:triosephosphate isomerase